MIYNVHKNHVVAHSDNVGLKLSKRWWRARKRAEMINRQIKAGARAFANVGASMEQATAAFKALGETGIKFKKGGRI